MYKIRTLVFASTFLALVYLPNIASALSLGEMRKIVIEHQFGQKGMDIFDKAALQVQCPLRSTCLSALEGLIIVHQGDKASDRDVFVIDHDALARISGETYGAKNRQTYLTALRMHMHLRKVKVATIPCHSATLVREFIWPKKERAFQVKDLRGSTRGGAKPKQMTPLQANNAYISFWAKVKYKGNKNQLKYARKLFSDEQLGSMTDPSFRTPRLRIDFFATGLFTNRETPKAGRGMMVTLSSPESTRVLVSSFDTTWHSPANEKARDKKLMKLEIKQQRQLEATVLRILKSSKAPKVHVDLKTVCQIPSLFGLDPDRLIVKF